MDLNFKVCERACEKRGGGNLAAMCDTVMSNLRATDPSLQTAAVTLQKLYYRVKKTKLDIAFLTKCCDQYITPKFVRLKNLKSKRHNLLNATIFEALTIARS